MTWQNWPNGQENDDGTGYHPISQCPVCHTSLRPIRIDYTFEPNYYDPERRTLYTAICPQCRTKYYRDTKKAITISPDAETITELEERIRGLEQTVSRLVEFIRQTQVQPEPKEQKSKRAKDEKGTEDFTRRYKHLL